MLIKKEQASSGLAFPRPKDKEGAWEGKEKDLQKLCEGYIKQFGVYYIHIPDDLLHYLRFKAPAWIAKSSSLAFKGLPDLIILNKNKVLCVELKTKNGKLSRGQSAFAKKVDVHLIRSFDDFRLIFDNFLKK